MKFTDFIAIYAALLSTIVFVWNVRSSRSVMKVSLVYGRGSGDEFQFGVYLGIQNLSSHEIYINSVSLLYLYRPVSFWEKIKFVFEYHRFSRYIGWVHNAMVFDGIETGLPRIIEARNSHSIFIPEEKITSTLEGGSKFAAVAQDALWRNTYSAPFEMHHSHREK